LNRRGAFSLIEMLLATALAAVLMGAVLTLVAGVYRDARMMQRLSSRPVGGLLEGIARELGNVESFSQASDGRELALIGNIGIDRRTLSADSRLARVVYRVGPGGSLRREQTYIDAPERPAPWGELVAARGVERLFVVRDTGTATRARVVVETRRGTDARDVRFR
jgi:prepilin-type N-terminal cleavage/methylation domain-containing protein